MLVSINTTLVQELRVVKRQYRQSTITDCVILFNNTLITRTAILMNEAIFSPTDEL